LRNRLQRPQAGVLTVEAGCGLCEAAKAERSAADAERGNGHEEMEFQGDAWLGFTPE
jgi:hypothetical protein